MELSEQITDAFYGKLNVSGVTSKATGGVFTDDIFFETVDPFVVIKFVDGIPMHNLRFTEVMRPCYVHVTAYADRENASPLSPQGLINQILEACDSALLGEVLVLEEGTCKGLKLDMEMGFMKAKQVDRNHYSRTKRYKVWANNEPSSIETFYTTFAGNRQTFNGNRLTFGA